MSLGVVILAHTALHRVRQTARHWLDAGCRVVIHVDKSVDAPLFEDLVAAFADSDDIRFSDRSQCEWGTWSIVQATQDACETMLAAFPDVGHVYLTSGACLPVRPVDELVDYLSANPDTDFIESATTSDVVWTRGGLNEERFSLYFPFPWKRRRWLFDKAVTFQRSLNVHRRAPAGLVPHMGSQWWCLTRKTLSAILESPTRARHDGFFRSVWIPDESYFQTLVRLYGQKIESRSLTLSKFDHQGRPHIFYDDHLGLLQKSGAFVARKIWPDAHGLYDTFLSPSKRTAPKPAIHPRAVDRVFENAVDRRTRGRAGLYMQSRYPCVDWEYKVTAGRYTVIQGFGHIISDLENWLCRSSDCDVHGRLFAPDRAHFSFDQPAIGGMLTDSAVLRDYNPNAFLQNVLWNTRGRHQCFQLDPADQQPVLERIAQDPNAAVFVVSGAWALSLHRSGAPFDTLRERAAILQKTEQQQIARLNSPWTKARVQVWTLAEFMASPMVPLQSVVANLRGSATAPVAEAPELCDVQGFAEFLQRLRNTGMHPYLTGEFPVQDGQDMPNTPVQKPFLMR